MNASGAKRAVRDYWNGEPCGTRGMEVTERRAYFAEMERIRYELEPYIPPFARFEEGKGKKVLEIGVGAGQDFTRWVRAGADAIGIDYTPNAVALTKEALAVEGLSATVWEADAENLPFRDRTFDLVWSWGVLHHTPQTREAIGEVLRVLKDGGTARVMIYAAYSWVTLSVWLLHGLRRFRGVRWASANHLESPGTKVYTTKETRDLFRNFSRVSIRRQLVHGDLLEIVPAERYRHGLARVLWRLYPRWFIRLTGNMLGTGLLIEATK